MSFISRIQYAFWYFRRPPWDSGITPPELMDFLRSCPVGRAIDLGCGTGTNCITLSQLGWQVTGVDFVPAAIDQARKKARKAGLSPDLRVADVSRLPGIEGPFDFALDLGCYHSLDEREKSAYLDQLDRILIPGSQWFMYGFLRLPGQSATSGISAQDLERLQNDFRLVSRMDGYDRGKKPSAYFIFEKLDKGQKKAE